MNINMKSQSTYNKSKNNTNMSCLNNKRKYIKNQNTTNQNTKNQSMSKSYSKNKNLGKNPR